MASQKPQADDRDYSFTATLGGPLVIPHIVKTPFPEPPIQRQLFAGQHNLNGIDSLSTVPTASLLAGDFNDLSKPAIIYDPLTPGMPFAGNIDPAIAHQFGRRRLTAVLSCAPTYNNLLVQNFRLIANTPTNSQSIGIRLFNVSLRRKTA